jgi:hypothetical protein
VREKFNAGQRLFQLRWDLRYYLGQPVTAESAAQVDKHRAAIARLELEEKKDA